MSTARLVDGSTTVWLRTAAPSFAVDAMFLQELDLGYPAVRESKQDTPGQHGSTDLTQFFGERQVTAKVKIFGDHTLAAEGYEDLLRALAHPARRPYLYVQRDGWAAERRLRVRGNTYSCLRTAASAIYLEVQLALVAPDGTMEDASLSTVAVYAQSAIAGLSAPVSFGSSGVSLTPASLGSQAVVTNDGTVATPPVYQIYGGCSDPAIINNSTGESLSFTGLSIPTGHYLEIDVANRTAYMDSDPSQSYYSKIDWSSSTWWWLAGGDSGGFDNLVTFDATSPTSSAVLYVNYRSRWI